jgi:hypothetical protein
VGFTGPALQLGVSNKIHTWGGKPTYKPGIGVVGDRHTLINVILCVKLEVKLAKGPVYTVAPSRIHRVGSKGKTRVGEWAVIDTASSIPKSIATKILRLEYLRCGHIINVG